MQFSGVAYPGGSLLCHGRAWRNCIYYATVRSKRQKCKLRKRGRVVDAKLPFQPGLRTNEYVTWNLDWFDDIANRAKFRF